jgi:hypothetical protein
MLAFVVFCFEKLSGLFLQARKGEKELHAISLLLEPRGGSAEPAPLIVGSPFFVF